MRGPAKISNFSIQINLINWLLRHLQVSLSSLGRLSRDPLNTLMTGAVIGIAIALPAGLFTLIQNIETLSADWDGTANISLFLKQETSEKTAQALAKRLKIQPAISNIRYISAKEALQEFRDQSGFGAALDLLSENPLPPVLLIKPSLSNRNPDQAAALAKELGSLPEADFAQVDLQWVRRLQAITETAERAILVLASLLSTAVLLIIGNTIRLEIQNRHAEIEITRLVGATDAFIRRPFLYDGLWYGLVGAIIALILVVISTWLLQGPIARLAGLYQSSFDLASLSPRMLLLIILGSPLLGLTGAWIAVGRHLQAIEPD